MNPATRTPPGPRYELHCHLDGSVRPATLRALAEEQGLALTRSVELVSGQ
ncbi:hypothetical protein ACWD6I_29585 [Streptomyces sp. NPDC002454]